jgi:hypothetical protein
MERLLVLVSIISQIFLFVKKQSWVLSLFTWREKRIKRLFQDVENTKSFPMRLKKQMVPGTLGVPCGENHR